MRKSLKLAMGAAFGLMVLAAAPMAMAQDDIGSQIIPSVEYEQADIREALRAIFKTVNVSFTIDPDVQGTVDAHLKDKPFDTVLQNLLRQVDATYQVQGGVYRIMRVPDDVTVGNSGEETGNLDLQAGKVVRRIKIRYADPQFIALMIGANGGSQNYTLPPEISTLQSSGGGMGGMGGGMGGFGGGMGGMGGGMGGFGGGMGGFGGGMGGGMGGFGGGGMGGFGGGGGFR